MAIIRGPSLYAGELGACTPPARHPECRLWPGRLAGTLAVLGRWHRVARPFGAAEALRERTGSVIGLAALRQLCGRRLAALRAQLDADELAAEWAKSRALTLDKAIDKRLRSMGRILPQQPFSLYEHTRATLISFSQSAALSPS